MSRPRVQRGERGFSLIEVIVASMIVGIAFVVFVGGMGAAIMGSDHHRKLAVVQAGIRDFAEAVKSARFDTNCGTAAANYLASYSPPPPTRIAKSASKPNGALHATPSLDPASSRTVLLSFFTLSVGATFSVPAGTVELWDLASTGADPAQRVSAAFSDETRTTSEPTGSRSSLSTGAGNDVAQSLLLEGGPSAYPVRRAVATAASAGATTLTIAKPTGTIAGDAMIAQIAVRSASAEVAPPPGWTMVTSMDDGLSLRSVLFEKTATAAPSDSFVWTFSEGVQAVGGIASYSNVRRSYSASVSAVKWWDNASSSFATTCPSAESQAIQLVSLRLQSDDDKSVQTVDVVKRCAIKTSPTAMCGDS